MDRVLKRVTHKKQSSSSGLKTKQESTDGVSSSSSINKHYSVDDNFHTYVNRSEVYVNCDGSNYYTISNRGKSKCNTVHRSLSVSKQENGERASVREDAAFKKFFKVFNSGENSRGAKDWLATSANNMMDFAPKILTKRFCGKTKCANELYRSNSFKFERFERTDSDTLSSSKKSPVSRQISLCDDYSIPVDFVNKRPLSLDSGSAWSAPSPNGDQVEVLNLYCDPKDSAKSQKNPASDDLIPSVNVAEVPIEASEDKLASLYSVVQKGRKERVQPVVRDSSEDGEDEDDEPELYENLKHRKLTGSLSRSAALKGDNIVTYTEVRKSPYYYSDILKRSQSEEKPDRRRNHDLMTSSRKCQSLDVTGKQQPESLHQGATATKYADSALNSSFDIREEDEENEDMTGKQRHMYETAFDSKICRSDDTMLDMDIVSNHLMERCSPQPPLNPAFYDLPVGGDSRCSLKGLKNAKNKSQLCNKFESSVDSISQQLTDLDFTVRSTLLHGYSSASTSTFPLPQSISSNINDSLDSFSESSHRGTLCHSNNFFTEVEKRLQNTSSPIYGNCLNNNSNNNNNNNKRNKNINNINNSSSGRHHRHQKHRLATCYRNADDSCCVSDSANDSSSHPESRQINTKILEIKGRPRERRGKFSSTESMATCSSSGGSLESIRSSTSEGNRSTTSTDSNRSTSLSSHSSDSAAGRGAANRFVINYRFVNQNKMNHVLSPISDKSFQEAGSESSDVNRPDENKSESPGTRADSQSAVNKLKRRTLQNKNVLANLGIPSFTSNNGGDVDAQQCSDSGISIGSKSDKATKASEMVADLNEDDLPFDMPKLRRRRLQQVQNSTQDTSSSATSVDLKDLPFDIPKLRCKMKSVSMDGSTELPLDSDTPLAPLEKQSENGADKQAVPNLDSTSRNRKSLGLSLNLNEIIPASYNIDIDLPLERQGWYHGAISRLEAENELRNREEGSFLVRNSESAKNDYSLSLKSAKGFMHMRIQKAHESNKFILGQFSSPFLSIPQMIKHYSSSQLPIRGAEHMCLLQPVIAQLL